jgi:hypothetical protein
VIDERDPEQCPRLHQLDCQRAVGLTWSTVAARVVVNHQRTGHSLAQERPKDIGGTDLHAIDLAQCGDVPAANAVASIETEDVNRLLLALS